MIKFVEICLALVNEPIYRYSYTEFEKFELI